MSLEAAVVSVPPLGLVKMEDRKRASASDHHDDSAPPAKRQATNANGPSAESAGDGVKFGTHGSPWQTELETFQKDALIRQMREFKREKSQLELQLLELQKSAKLHDEYILSVDSFPDQLLDMVRTRAGDLLAVGSRVGPQLTSSILSSDIKKFQAYLSERSASVISALEELFARQPWSPPEPTQLQQLLDKTLAAERDHIQKLQQVNNEKEQLAGRLENATERYLKAEKKLDRSKSVAVAAIDRQGQLQSHLAPPEQSTATVNGDSKAASPEATAAAVQEAEEAKMEAEAVAKKRKEQLEMLESENKKLTEQITSLTSQLSNLSDDDYAKTELFRVAKSQHEDLIKRIEHLEATNVQLREEAKKLQAERTAYRAQMEDESSVAVKESEGDLAKAESNEQRLRAERDATQSRMAILENSRSEHKVTINKLQELVDARDSRIQDLEAEISQLETQLRETDIDAETGLDDISIDELKTKLITVQKERALLQQETTHMETALKKFQGLAVKKVDEFRSFEDRIGQLQAEKSKAEQKYFGAMKAKDARILERDALATQNKKTSSLIAAFKEAIAKLEENVRLLEKQIAEQRDAIESLTYQQQTEHQKMSQAEFTSAQKESHIQELQKSLQGKDASVSTAQQLQREAEVEVEKLKVSLVEAKKKAEEWRNKARSNPSDEVEMLMRVAYCTSCNRNLKDTMLKTCGHAMCRECVNERQASRSRKCPHCLKAFGANDVIPVHLV